jgi:hypothetical protein
MQMLVGLGIGSLAWIKAKEAWLAPFLLSVFRSKNIKNTDN